jgi:hypothetical protein
VRWTILLILASGCEFHSNATVTDGGPIFTDGPDHPSVDVAIAEVDAPSNTSLDAAIDAAIDGAIASCFGQFVTVCLPPVLPDLSLAKSGVIDTDQDPRCVMQGQGPGAPVLCVLAGMDVEVDAAIAVIGSHPLVVAAIRDLRITATGSLSLTSGRDALPGAGANDPLCGSAAAGVNGTTGAGGGAGGSFGGTGGGGGAGATSAGTPSTPFGALTRVVGGCAGSGGGDVGAVTGGAPGNGGGGVVLLAGRTLTLDGFVTAGGGGGATASAQAAGGGGGGSGGFVALDAVAYEITGLIAANGGGGGSGAGLLSPGASGGDGIASATVAASGGVGGEPPVAGGAGGRGSLGVERDGDIGRSTAAGGGGGGGGAGLIVIEAATLPSGGTYSPQPTLLP